jgi:hypothetical protein
MNRFMKLLSISPPAALLLLASCGACPIPIEAPEYETLVAEVRASVPEACDSLLMVRGTACGGRYAFVRLLRIGGSTYYFDAETRAFVSHVEYAHFGPCLIHYWPRIIQCDDEEIVEDFCEGQAP